MAFHVCGARRVAGCREGGVAACRTRPPVPMRQVYEMFRGALTPEQVIAAAGSQPDAQFYGYLYVGLYFEVLGMKERALQFITMAAADRFERAGGYMHMVARVHLRALSR